MFRVNLIPNLWQNCHYLESIRQVIGHTSIQTTSASVNQMPNFKKQDFVDNNSLRETVEEKISGKKKNKD